MFSETVHLDGHIIDSGTLSKVLDLILLHGGDYEITTFNIGTTREAASHAEIVVRAEAQDDLHRILQEVGQHGRRADRARRRVGGRAVGRRLPRGLLLDDQPRKLCPPRRPMAADRAHRDGLRRGAAGRAPRDRTRLTVPAAPREAGDRVLVHEAGVKVVPAPRKDPVSVFGFMSSEVSAERPKELTVAAVAEGMIDTRRRGSRILFVGGPAIIHTGAGRYLEALIAGRWIDVLFAGNALATHDIESALLGTSLGVRLSTGVPTATGHNHHLRAINAIRGAGGDPRRCCQRPPDERRDARLRGPRRGLRARRQHSRRRAAARCDHRQRARPGRDAHAHRRRRPGHHGGDDAAFRGDREPAARRPCGSSASTTTPTR